MIRGPRQIAMAIAAASILCATAARAQEPGASSPSPAPPAPAAPTPGDAVETPRPATAPDPGASAPARVPAKTAAPTKAAAEAPRSATSPPPAEEKKFGEPEPKIPEAERRSGFAVGLSTGFGLGASNGYPNDPKKIGRSAFYTESGVGLANYGGIWLGGALADAFNFGIGFGGGDIMFTSYEVKRADGKPKLDRNGDPVTRDYGNPAGGIMFHLDVYPLYTLGDAWRDLGIQIEAGTGGANTVDDEDDTIVFIDGAGAGAVSAAVFFEAKQAWKIRMAPYLGGHYMFSETVRRPSLLVGFRAVLYTGP